MAERKASTTLPRLRVSSHSFADFSSHNISTLTSRTVSSSTSTISTPSNNIRRVKQEQAFVDHRNEQGKKKSRGKKGEFQPKAAKSTKKLLNFQQMKKSYAPSQSFVLHKPANLSQFDHSVFTKRPAPLCEDTAVLPQTSSSPSSPPDTMKAELLPVRQSQLKAWESAESITSNRVFDYCKLDDESWLDEGTDEFIEEEVSIDRGTDEWTEPNEHQGILLSLPGLSKAELKVVSDHFTLLEECIDSPDVEQHEKEEKKALWALAMQESEEYEKSYASNYTISGKRRVQVLQKRAFLQKLFGYFNNINTEFTTNNSSYSAVDGTMSAQKAFLEDKEELCELLEQQQAFQQSLEETKERLKAANSISIGASRYPYENGYQEVDPAKLVEATSHWLNAHYQRDGNDILTESDDDDPDIVAAAMMHLKECVASATDETMDE